MNLKFIQGLAGILLATLAYSSFAAKGDIVCTASSPTLATSLLPGYFANFAPATANVTLMNFNVTCVRDSATGQASAIATYSVAADNGIHFLSPTRRAQFGATTSFVKYDLYKDAACSLPWNAANPITRAVTMASPTSPNVTTVVSTETFYACIPANTTLTYTSGHHTDTVALTVTGVTDTPSVKFAGGVNGSLGVDIFAPVTCSISSTPTPNNISLSYTAFQGSAVKGNTPFAVNCSSGLVYTMKITDATNTTLVTDAVAAGLNYSLGVSASAAGTPTTSNPLQITGTGSALTSYIIVTIPANQAGSCLGGCSKTNTHYLTLEY